MGSRKIGIVKSILEKAYSIKNKSRSKCKNNILIHLASQRSSSVKNSSLNRSNSAKFSISKNGKQLVLDVSVELGVSVPEVLEAYQYIIDQTSVSAGKQNRNKAKAIIFDRKRLMRKALRSLILFL